MSTPTSKNIYFLIAASCINEIYDVFLGVFMVSFLFKQTSENVVDISIYHLACYFVVGVMAYLTGNWMKRGNRVLMYQFGIISTFIFFISFLFLKERVIDYIPLYGALFGIITSFKAFPFNLIVADSIPFSKMIAFKGCLEGLKSTILVVSPLLLGFFLTFDSYFNTIAFLAFMAFVEFIFSSQIKFPLREKAAKLDIKTFWKRTKKLKFLQHLYKMEFCRGMTVEGTLGTLITLYIVYLFHTDFNLGLISSIFYGMTIVLNFVFGRYCQYKYFVRILAFAAILVISSVAIFIFIPGKASFIFYNFCFIVLAQFMRIIVDINMYNVSNLPEVIEHKNEYFIVRELFVNSGRLLSYGLLLIVGMFNNYDSLKYLLLFLTLFVTFMSISGIKLNKYFMNFGKE